MFPAARQSWAAATGRELPFFITPIVMDTVKKTRMYRLGDSTLTLVFGDITKSEASVVVSSDDYYLSMGGGVSAAILRAGGEAIALDAAKKVPAQLGDVVVTTAGELAADYVFHAVTIGPHGTRKTPDEIVTSTVRKCLQLMEVMGLRSIAFPAIGTGAARLPLEDVAASMAKVIAAFTSEKKLTLTIELYLMDRLGNRTDFGTWALAVQLTPRVLAGHGGGAV